MRFEHDTYDIDVYSLCESVYYSCNNDEYDYVLECVNDWIINGYFLQEVSDEFIAKMLGDDSFRTYDDLLSSWFTPEPKLDLGIEDENWHKTGVSNAKDPLRRDMINAVNALRQAKKNFKTSKESLPETLAQIKPIDPHGFHEIKLRNRLYDMAENINKTLIPNYIKARTRYRSKYGKAPTGQNVEIVRDILPVWKGDNIYSWQDSPPAGPSYIKDLDYSNLTGKYQLTPPNTSQQEPPPTQPKQEPPKPEEPDPLRARQGQSIPPSPPPKQETQPNTPPKQDTSSTSHKQETPVVTSNNNQSRLSRATTWMKNNKVKGGLGVVAAGAAIGGSIYAYKRFKNRPKSVIAKRIQALRGIYKKFMLNAQRNPKKANLFKRVAAKILSVIDKLLVFLQHKADGR